MNDKIFNILNNSNKNNQIIELNEIINIFFILINEYSLGKYCKDIKLNNTENVVMAYLPHSEKIEINYVNLLEQIKIFIKTIKSCFKIDVHECIEIANLQILFCTLHELMHMKQIDILNFTRKDDLERIYIFNLLELSYLTQNLLGQKFYDENHNTFFHEYHADICAFYLLINTFLTEIPEDKEIIKNIFNIKLANFLLSQYKKENNKIISPLFTFNNICLNSILEKEKIEKINYFLYTIKSGDINDILLGRDISSDQYDDLPRVANYQKRTLNLFNDLYIKR